MNLPEKEEMRKPDKISLIAGWVMLSLALSLFILSFSIYLFGLEGVFTTKRFPLDTDTPCMLAFLVLGIIFLNLGIIYRDMSVHPEFFSEDAERKQKKKEEWGKVLKKRRSEDEEIRELLDGGEP